MNHDDIPLPFNDDEIKEMEKKIGRNDSWLSKTVENMMDSNNTAASIIASTAAAHLTRITNTLMKTIGGALGKEELEKDKNVQILAQASAIITWFALATSQNKIQINDIKLEIPRREPNKMS
jgi:hypothetical protein